MTRGTSQTQADTKTSEKQPTPAPVQIEILKAPVIQAETTDKTEKRNDYSSSEWWLVYLTFGLVLVTAALAIFTGYLYNATVNLGRDAKKSSDTQSDISRQMFLAENRPWISVTPKIWSALTYDAQGNGRVEIQFIATNVGKGPAIGVNVDAKLYVIFGNTPTLQRQFIEQHRQVRQQAKEFGVTLFPGEHLTATLNLPIAKQEMEEFGRSFAGQKSTGIPTTLIGCATYGFTFEDGIHQTGFIFDLNQRDPKNSNINLVIDTKDGPIPVGMLQLNHPRLGMPPD